MADDYMDTHGWDSVFAIAIDVVNSALKSLPASSRYQREDKAFGGETARIDWSFSGWRITDVPGGDRIEVTMDLSDDSKLTRIGSGSTETSLAMWSCVVEFRAHFEEHDPVTRKLRADAKGESWAIVKMVPPEIEPKPTGTNVILVQALLSDWFTSSTDAVELFRQEFLTVSLYEDPEFKQLPWLKPQHLGFAGGVMADKTTKALGILAMTGDRAPATASLTLSPCAIPANALAGLALSSELVMRNLFLPACAAAFSKSPPGDKENFRLSGASGPAYQQNKITNVNELEFTHEFDGAERAAKLPAGALDMQLLGDRLEVRMDKLHIETGHAGYTAEIKVLESDALALAPLDPPSKGKTFALVNKSLRTPEVSVVISPGLRVVEGIVALVVTAALAALGAVAFRGSATRVLGALGLDVTKISIRIISGAILVLAAVAGGAGIFAIEWIRRALEEGGHELPPFNSAFENTLRGISLPGGETVRFSVEQAEFSSGILVSIAPHLGEAPATTRPSR